MPSSDSNLPDALIVGCGFLGSVLAERLIANGSKVYGTTRDPQRARELAALHIKPLLVDVHQPITFAALRPALESDLLDVYYLLPPGQPRTNSARQGERQADPALCAIANACKAIEGAWIHRAIMTSSTGVYGQSGDEVVSADTQPIVTSDRAQRLLHLEKLWMEQGSPFRVLRLAGLYGPDRIVGLDALKQGHPLVGNVQAMLNLIHVLDAADLLIALARADDAQSVELGSDGSPTSRITYYEYLADRLGIAPPRIVDDETAAEMGLSMRGLRRASSKRCDPTPTASRTGWQPRYSDFRQGLEALLPAVV